MKRFFSLLLVVAVLMLGSGVIAPPSLGQADGVSNFTSITLDQDLIAGDDITAGGDLAITGDSSLDGDLTVGGNAILSSTAVTLTGASNFTPASSYYILSSAAVCTITLQTTGAVAGQLLYLYGDDNNSIVVTDNNIKTTTGSALTIGQYDLLGLVFNGTAWVEMFLAADS